MSALPANDKWATQLKKGVVELCVLNAIDGERRYGYEIAKELGDLEGLAAREGTVYPVLSRLRRDGLLQTTLAESPEGPPRKYYELTPLGRRHLKRMNAAWDRLNTNLRSLRRKARR